MLSIFPCGVFLLLGFFAYQIYFIAAFLRKPTGFNLGVNLRSRDKWVLLMMTDKSREITAVQTLRNGIMTTTFFATSASLIAFWSFSQAISVDSNPGGLSFRQVQFLFLGGAFALAFLNMSFAARGFFHVSFLIASKSLDPQVEEALKYTAITRKIKRNLFSKKPVKDLELGAIQPPAKIKDDKALNDKIDKWTARHIPSVVRLLRRSTIHFTLGMRFYYVAIPLAMWIIGSWPLFGGTIFIILLMYYADHSV